MTPVMNATFVYVIFIRATPDKLWSAVTTPDFMKQYWVGMSFETDWKLGSPWRMVFPDGRLADSGEIIDIDPPKRLVLKWQNEWNPEMKAEGYSQCTMNFESLEGVVKLTINHSMERAESKFIQAVSVGWPRILSNLKSLVETGDILFKS